MYIFLFVILTLDTNKAPKINWHKAWGVRAACGLRGAEGRERKEEKKAFKTLGQPLIYL